MSWKAHHIIVKEWRLIWDVSFNSSINLFDLRNLGTDHRSHPFFNPSPQDRVEACPPFPPMTLFLPPLRLHDPHHPIHTLTDSCKWGLIYSDLGNATSKWCLRTKEPSWWIRRWKVGGWKFKVWEQQHFILSNAISCSVTMPSTASYRTVPPSGIHALHQVPMSH